MTTLNQRIVEILKIYKAEFCGSGFYIEVLSNQILKAVHENPSIKQGLKLLKEKREQDVWDRGVKNKLRGK